MVGRAESFFWYRLFLSFLQLKISLKPKWHILRWHILIPYTVAQKQTKNPIKKFWKIEKFIQKALLPVIFIYIKPLIIHLMNLFSMILLVVLE